MRILFDQGTPAPLRGALSGHQVATVYELGWSTLSNGELLKKAEGAFDLLITTDQNLRYQQNLAGRQLAILVLMTTSWLKLRPCADQIAATALAMATGTYVEFQPTP
jgi:hypothetical protein